MKAPIPRFRRRLSLGEMLLLLLVAAALVRLAVAGLSAPKEFVPREGPHDVVRVMAGDTLLVRPKGMPREQRAAEPFLFGLLGIECSDPDSAAGRAALPGQQAADFTREFLAGRAIRLQFDRRRLDARGRHLGYAFLEDRCLNEELVRAGWARVATRPGDAEGMVRRLVRAEREARDAARGLWSRSKD